VQDSKLLISNQKVYNCLCIFCSQLVVIIMLMWKHFKGNSNPLHRMTGFITRPSFHSQ